jgi:hypothetical protein
MFDHSINLETNENDVFLIEFSEKRIYSSQLMTPIKNESEKF